jgi:type II secretory ATPase GspE/PulE/Tfp pilus assembly ATPase PilB-like protein
MDVPPYLIASSLAGVVAQRLARLNCRHCRVPVALDDPARLENSAALELPADAPCGAAPDARNVAIPARAVAWRSSNCSTLIPTCAAPSWTKQDSDTLRQIARKSGFKTLVDDGREKVLSGHPFARRSNAGSGWARRVRRDESQFETVF